MNLRDAIDGWVRRNIVDDDPFNSEERPRHENFTSLTAVVLLNAIVAGLSFWALIVWLFIG